MSYICKDCTNKTEFRQTAIGQCNYTEEQEIDQEGHTTDYGDTDYYDMEQSDTDDLCCSSCGSTNVKNVNEAEWIEWNGPKPKTWKDKFPKKKK